MNRYKIIVNPTSGRGTGGRSVPVIEETLRSAGLDFDLVLTERPWHAAELAQAAAADGYAVVVAAGGDGTANEVVNGLMAVEPENRPVMAVLCVGRGNDMAYGMNIPTHLEPGLKTLLQGHQQLVDVGRVTGGLYPQGRYFGNGVGIGFDAVVGFVAKEMTLLRGFISYLVAALETMFLYYKAPDVRIEFDGQVLTMPALMVSVMNGQRMGGGFMMAPEAKNDDGQFDLCIARQVSRPNILRLMLRFMKGTQASDPAITAARTAQLRVTAVKGVLPAHTDGETLCTEGDELVLELLPRQIRMICEPPKEA